METDGMVEVEPQLPNASSRTEAGGSDLASWDDIGFSLEGGAVSVVFPDVREGWLDDVRARLSARGTRARS